MKVLVLGGTGAMGMHLVHLLSNNGVETIVTSRKQRAAEKNISYIQGNAHNIKFLQTILHEPWDAIVDFMIYTTGSFKERVNLLLDATSQYVFLSSSRVYADSETPITEDSSRLLDVSQDKVFLSTDEYSLAKARQENILRTSKRKNWTIIRPYITYSENRLQLGVLEKEEWLYRALQGRTIVFSSAINSKFTTLTYGLDVANGIMAVIGNSKALGDAFHITINNPITWNDVLGMYLGVLGKSLGQKPKVLLQDLQSFIKCTPRKYQIYYDRLFDREFNNSKISRYLNVDNFTKAEVGLKKCLEDFLVNPSFNSINWKLEALRDRQTRERTRLKEIQNIKQKAKYLFFRYLKTS
jgi:nucleoside-diphosphate-sugar epimerase